MVGLISGRRGSASPKITYASEISYNGSTGSRSNVLFVPNVCPGRGSTDWAQASAGLPCWIAAVDCWMPTLSWRNATKSLSDRSELEN